MNKISINGYQKGWDQAMKSFRDFMKKASCGTYQIVLRRNSMGVLVPRNFNKVMKENPSRR